METLIKRSRCIARVVIIVLFIISSLSSARAATQLEITGPVGSGAFGTNVSALPNGNIVVTDPSYDITTPSIIADVGAAYLYNGANGALISMITGSKKNDRIGSNGIIVLSSGNYLISSSQWDNNSAVDAGAVTFGNGSTGVSGTVSDANSLVGSYSNDLIGSRTPKILADGDYLLINPVWNISRGAVTWGNAQTGVTGVISSSNSLIGSNAGERVGTGSNGIIDVTELSNGDYVVISSSWNNNRGAVTLCKGSSTCNGEVSASNSLVGSGTSDSVGIGGITKLTNGNYVIRSYLWDNGSISNVGAVTFGDANNPLTGEVSAANSLVGSRANDQISNTGDGVTVLANGNYVVLSPSWNGYYGAATFGRGIGGISGEVSAANSLVGSTSSDFYISGITALTNGNYVVRLPRWSSNSAQIPGGAATFGNGSTGIIGAVSISNSLVGCTCDSIKALPNGNYAVNSNLWNGARGAVTFGDGTIGITGIISSSNSLVGSNNGDYIGYDGITILTNGNYVVSSSSWNGLRGAVTFVNGTTGLSGEVSTLNSLVGIRSGTGDRVGNNGTTALPNGNYVARSTNWNGARGAATFGNGSTGISGEVSSANSLVGNNSNDYVGANIKTFSNGNYLILSPNWMISYGAVTFGDGLTGISGILSSFNSLVGTNSTDYIGNGDIIELGSGNYILRSLYWNNFRGAVTFINNLTGVSGEVSAANSLVGNAPNDSIGSSGVTILTNGNYVVNSPIWDKNGILDAGAVTWGDGINGSSGIVSEANSLTGNVENDRVGISVALNNGGYIISSSLWDNGAIINAGAITLNNSNTPLLGSINANNSVLGATANAGYTLVYTFDYLNKQLIVGRPADNTVTLFKQTVTKSRKRVRFF